MTRAAQLVDAAVEVLGVHVLTGPAREAIARDLELSGPRFDTLVAAAFLRSSSRRMSAAEHRVLRAHFTVEAKQDVEPALDGFVEPADKFRLLRFLLVAAGAGPDSRPRVAEAAADLGIDPVLVAALTQAFAPLGVRRVPLVGRRLQVGSAPDCEVWLPDSRVDPVHAEVVGGANGWRVVARGPRAPLLDGAPVASAPLQRGANLQVGPFELAVGGGELVVTEGRRPFLLEARALVRRVGDVAVLDGPAFTAVSGELIAIVGPSGAGKTSLAAALAGGEVDDGGVCIDGVSIRDILKADPCFVAEVPQDDLLYAELTVEESLTWAARLRLAPGADVPAAVNRTLSRLGVEGTRARRVGSIDQRGISGGQRKRVNLGVEIVSRNTRVLILDEPTSGLDPRAAAEIARAARSLADSGALVFLVTHDMSAELFSQVDHLLVMCHGGRLAWFGPPAGALEHFQARSHAQIVARLEDRPPAEWVARFARHDAGHPWLRLRAWAAQEGVLGGAPRGVAPRPSQLAIAWALVLRYARVKRRDRTGVTVLVAQPLLLAAVLGLVFSHPTAGLVFMVSLSCLWFGMSASVRELIADRPIWLREQKVGVSAAAWLVSKVLVLVGVVALQCVVFVAIAHGATGLGDGGFSLLGMAAVGVLTGFLGVSAGLAVSASTRSSEAAVGAVILLLVPQIVFAGVLLPIGEMSPAARAIAAIVPERYAFHLMLHVGKALHYLRPSGWQERPVSGELFLMGLRPAGEGQMGLSVLALVAILAGVSAVLLVAAWRMLRVGVRS